MANQTQVFEDECYTEPVYSRCPWCDSENVYRVPTLAAWQHCKCFSCGLAFTVGTDHAGRTAL